MYFPFEIWEIFLDVVVILAILIPSQHEYWFKVGDLFGGFFQIKEAVIRRCCVKKMFLKRDSGIDFSCEFCTILKATVLQNTPGQLLLECLINFFLPFSDWSESLSIDSNFDLRQSWLLIIAFSNIKITVF